MNGLKLLGSISIFFGILFLLLPLLSTPVIKGLSFWKAVFQIDEMKIEVRAGMWGVCTYYRDFSGFKNHKEKEKMDLDDDEYEVRCTKSKAGYSFRMSSTVPDATGELSTTQTLFVLLWSIFASLIGLAALALSFSPNYYQWKHAAILALTSSILGFGIFLTCVVIFTGLTRETRMTDSAKTIPLYGSLQGDSFFSLSASVLLGIGAGILWHSFRKGFFELHRRPTPSRGDEKRMSLESEITQPLPPSTLESEGINRNQWPRESRHGTEIPRELPQTSQNDEPIAEESADMELEEIRARPAPNSSDADDELDTELQSHSSFEQDGSVTSNSISYIHSSDGLPPPPPLQSLPNNRFVTKKFR